MLHESMITTQRGLQRDIPPMRLYEKVKIFGVWDPTDIDLTQGVWHLSHFTPGGSG